MKHDEVQAHFFNVCTSTYFYIYITSLKVDLLVHLVDGQVQNCGSSSALINNGVTAILCWAILESCIYFGYFTSKSYKYYNPVLSQLFLSLDK